MSRLSFLAVLLVCGLPSSDAAAPKPLPRAVFESSLATFKNDPSGANREAVIKAARTLKPAPAPPEEAERRMARGAAAVADAKTSADFLAAAAEFEAATLAAPWWGDAYYNLGVAYDKAGKPLQAVAALKLAVAADPASKDAKTLMYQVEFRAEKAQDPLKNLEGDWYQLDVGKNKANAATWDDYNRRWSLKSYPGGAKLWISHERWGGKVSAIPEEKAGITLTATVKDGDVVWESIDRYGECGSAHAAPAKVSIQENGAIIDIRLEQLIPRRGVESEGEVLQRKGVSFASFDSACVVGRNYPYRLGRGE